MEENGIDDNVTNEGSDRPDSPTPPASSQPLPLNKPKVEGVDQSLIKATKEEKPKVAKKDIKIEEPPNVDPNDPIDATKADGVEEDKSVEENPSPVEVPLEKRPSSGGLSPSNPIPSHGAQSEASIEFPTKEEILSPSPDLPEPPSHGLNLSRGHFRISSHEVVDSQISFRE